MTHHKEVWLLAGDDAEDTFHERLKDELTDNFNNPSVIPSSFSK